MKILILCLAVMALIGCVQTQSPKQDTPVIYASRPGADIIITSD